MKGGVTMDYTKNEIIEYIKCLLCCYNEALSSEAQKQTVLSDLKPSSFIYVLTCIENYINERT